jgi:hypothetical protein
MQNSNDTTGNRTRDLAASSAVRQPSTAMGFNYTTVKNSCVTVSSLVDTRNLNMFCRLKFKKVTVDSTLYNFGVPALCKLIYYQKLRYSTYTETLSHVSDITNNHLQGA